MVSEAMLPRAAVREVEQRLTAAGCPDADFDARELFRLATGRDVRLSDRPLTAEQAAALEVLCTRRAARECWTSAPGQAVWGWGSSASAPPRR